MIKVIVLMGKSGSGKDTLREQLCRLNSNFHKVLNTTSRPIRENESDGKDYHFVSKQDFEMKIQNQDVIAVRQFNDWYYGLSLDSFDADKINVCILDINGYEQLKHTKAFVLTPIYIDVSNKTRLIRCLEREPNPNCYEICRRFIADEKDFSVLTEQYMKNDDFIIFDNN